MIKKTLLSLALLFSSSLMLANMSFDTTLTLSEGDSVRRIESKVVVADDQDAVSLEYDGVRINVKIINRFAEKVEVEFEVYEVYGCNDEFLISRPRMIIEYDKVAHLRVAQKDGETKSHKSLELEVLVTQK